ncbi:MAG: hypothetical protein M9949_07105 [Candidatus Kapabacteria bacterium]|nr:hypothetical protein [Candidatus Kapabacteria bacterium]
MTKVFKQFTLAITMLISFLAAGQTLAQNVTDTIRVEYSFWGNSYYLGDTEHSKSEIRDLLYANPSSQKLVKSYGNYKTWGYISLAGGTVLTGVAIYSIWDLYSNRHTYTYEELPRRNSIFNNFTVALLIIELTVAIDLMAILLLNESNDMFHRAVKAYNNKNSLISNLDYKFYIGYNRIGVVVVFN